MVYLAGLENRADRKIHRGSNPLSSAMKHQFSAGGIVFKKSKKDVLVLVAKHSQHKGWVFPKGLIGDNIKGEKKEDTALREVFEETGVKAKIIKPLKEVSYWFVFEKEKIKKTVYYFLMEYVSENKDEKDNEMEEVEWLEKEKVKNRLTYKSDKVAWEEARELIK